MPVHAKRLFGLMLLAYVVLVAYGAVEPACDSALIEAEGTDAYPWVWLSTFPILAAAVATYAWFARRVPLPQLFRGSILATVALQVLLVVWVQNGFPLGAYALYIWKDVHIVVLLETVWAFANLNTPIEHAKRQYGLLLVVGSLGAMSGAGVTGVLAEIGSTGTLLLPAGFFIVLYLLGFWVPRWFSPKSTGVPAPAKRAAPQGAEVAPTDRSTRPRGYVIWLLLMVISVQVFITLVDYQYKANLEAAYPRGISDAVVAERTRVAALVGFAKDGGALLLQVMTGPILRGFGASWVLLALPAISGAVTALGLFLPGLYPIAAAKVVGKAIDYSLFKAGKELLYIPLSYAEKTRGKALVDMAGYRGAKSGVSLVLVVIAATGGMSAQAVLGVALAFVASWFVITRLVVRRFRAMASS